MLQVYMPRPILTVPRWSSPAAGETMTFTELDKGSVRLAHEHLRTASARWRDAPAGGSQPGRDRVTATDMQVAYVDAARRT